ncbi:unnamed protein product [Linum tenue]|uniref:Berberine/berberine-like domain-containing protein n=1 Tax=Linum tenue TaxID=586396 RepID=A0AAV0QK82_9ROSI|nr:unnamed protein product [Linum tenue]
MVPLGGRMDEISDSSIPFPNRAGNLYQVRYLSFWTEDGLETAERHIGWLRELYDLAAPYVSSNPRSAYVNYRDLDIGMNDIAKVWGEKYFGNNFDRLARVKAAVDAHNFFRNEQSIVPIPRRLDFLGKQ